MTDAPGPSPARRSRTLRLAAALVAGAVLAAAVLALVPPAIRPGMPSDPEARAEALEQAIAAAVTRVRGAGPERWAVAIDPDDLNAWLATRLPKWIAHDPGLAALEPATMVRLAADRGALVLERALEVPFAPSSELLVGTLRLPVGVERTGETTRLSVEVGGASVGRLPIPAFAGLSALGEHLREALARIGERHAERDGGLRLRLADGRSVALEFVACEPGRIVVGCTTHPAVAPSGSGADPAP